MIPNAMTLRHWVSENIRPFIRQHNAWRYFRCVHAICIDWRRDSRSNLVVVCHTLGPRWYTILYYAIPHCFTIPCHILYCTSVLYYIIQYHIIVPQPTLNPVPYHTQPSKTRPFPSRSPHPIVLYHTSLCPCCSALLRTPTRLLFMPPTQYSRIFKCLI